MTTIEKPTHPEDDLDGPADTRMMRIVHTALRSDLARTQVALAELALHADDARREAVAAHLQWMMTWLHHHHEGEDTGLYPFVRARNAEARALLDEMDADHQRILPAMAEVERAASAYAASAGAGDDVVTAVDDLLACLLPHLKREEEEMMPVVAATITDREWRELDQKHNIEPLSKSELAASGLWIIDGLQGEDYEHVTHLVPAVPRFLISRFLISATAARPTCAGASASTPASGCHCEGAPRSSYPPPRAGLVGAHRSPRGGVEPRVPRATWLDGATRAEVGARFRGRNRSGLVRWSRPCTITASVPGRELAYETDGGWMGDCSEWRFALEPEGAGTRLTQSFRVVRMPRWADRAIVALIPSTSTGEAALRADLVRLGEVAAGTHVTRSYGP